MSATGSARPIRKRSEQEQLGHEARRHVPRERLGDWAPAPDRPSAVSLLAAQEVTRVPELLDVRHERMAASPFAFYRGAAAVMAADLAPHPATGLDVQLCGDAHLANFGMFASPERRLVFDLNDFDETLAGPFEWDLKRLAASFEVAGRANGLTAHQCAGVVDAMARSYCQAMREFAGMSNLEVWHLHLTVDDIERRWISEASQSLVHLFRQDQAKAERHTSLRALQKLTEVVDGKRRFLSQPPLLQPIDEVMADQAADVVRARVGRTFEGYLDTLLPDRRDLVERFELVDVARKVVGVGSVGTRCWVALLIGHDEDDPLLLQLKEAEPSVLEPYLGASGHRHHGQRVVDGQRIVQATHDELLGWSRSVDAQGTSHDFYVRQLWDGKGSVTVDSMTAHQLAVYAEICAYALAHSHARSGNAITLSAYLGGGGHVADAMVRFAAAYADQNEADHAALVAWVDAGCPPTA